MQPAGFVGLGLMGGPMAANLLKAGFEVTVYNRIAGKAHALVDAGGRAAQLPRDVATPGGVVVTMVADDNVLEALATRPDGFGERLGDAARWTGPRSRSACRRTLDWSPALRRPLRSRERIGARGDGWW